MIDLGILLLAAAGSAYGVAVIARLGAPRWAAAPALLLYVALGILSALLAWLTGDGVVVPGLQISPGLRAWYQAEVWQGYQPAPGAELLWLALPAHGLVALATRKAQRKLLPATGLFLAFFFLFQARAAQPIEWEQARGPGRVAYLTVAHTDRGARIIVATGEPMAHFLDVVCVHETRSAPPPLELFWTNDGAGLVIRVGKEHKPSFAVDLAGRVTGALPLEKREWPRPPDEFTPPDVYQRFQRARRDVGEFVAEHGGIYVE